MRYNRIDVVYQLLRIKTHLADHNVDVSARVVFEFDLARRELTHRGSNVGSYRAVFGRGHFALRTKNPAQLAYLAHNLR